MKLYVTTFQNFIHATFSSLNEKKQTKVLLSVYFATFICRRQLESSPKGFIFHFIVWDMYIKSVHVLKLKFLQLYQPDPLSTIYWVGVNTQNLQFVTLHNYFVLTPTP